MASLISSIGGEGGMIKLEHFKQWMHSLAVRAPVPAPFFLLGPPAGLTSRTQLAARPHYLGPTRLTNRQAKAVEVPLS